MGSMSNVLFPTPSFRKAGVQVPLEAANADRRRLPLPTPVYGLLTPRLDVYHVVAHGSLGCPKLLYF